MVPQVIVMQTHLFRPPHSRLLTEARNSAGPLQRTTTATALITCVSWNTDGLVSKLSDSDFMRYLQNSDIICLIKTFIDATFDLSSHFGDYQKYITPAVKLRYMGRRSGGLLLLIKKHLEPFVEIIAQPIDHITGVKLSEDLMKCSADVILIGTYYVPP